MKATRWRWRLIALVLTILSITSSTAFGVRIVSYNVLNYSGVGREEAFQSVLLDTPPAGSTETKALEPDLLILQEVADSAAAVAFSCLLNTLPCPDPSNEYEAGSFTDGLDTAIVYRKSIFEEVDLVAVSGLGHTVNRWQLRLVGYESDAATLYVYAIHAPAGTSPAALQARQEQALVVRQDASSSLPTGSRFLVAGDLQIRADNEASYTVFTGEIGGLESSRTTDVLNPTPDPGDPVVWHSNPDLAQLHTEHTNRFDPDPDACLTSGDCGMDDRYDFQLISTLLDTPVDFSYVPDTYRAYGNDGDHFEQAIDGGGVNAAVGLTIAGNLVVASDHLPVLAEYQVPARVAVEGESPAAPFEVTFNIGKIKQGQGIPELDEDRIINVANRVDWGEYGFVETLAYDLDLAGGFPIGPITGMATAGDFPISDTHEAEDFDPPPDPAGNDHLITLTISETAPLADFGPLAAFTLASNDPVRPTVTVNITGTVIPYLNVESNVAGVSMEVTDDVGDPDTDAQGTANDGLTPFTRGYDSQPVATNVTLTAEDPHPTDPDLELIRWEVGGTQVGTTVTTVVETDESKTAEAFYGFTLAVDCNVAETPIDVTDDVGDPDTDGTGAVNDGVAPFTRRYEWEPGLPTTVTLTAEDPHPSDPSLSFLQWEVDDGVSIEVSTDLSIPVVMDVPKTAVAVYGLALIVDSTVAATPIDVTDDVGNPHKDAAGDWNDGETPFTRSYDPGTTVTLTAPAAHEGQVFLRWELDDDAQCEPGTAAPSTINVLIDAVHTVVAFYGYELTVTSTPSDAVAITVTDDDPPPDDVIDGACQTNDGTTPFSRRYDPDTVVTLLAPAQVGEALFLRWDVDGGTGSSSNPTVLPMSEGHAAVAVYSEGLLGDCDEDNDVDLDDLALFVGCLNQSGPDVAAPPTCECEDLDGDGDVDLRDFALFQIVFTGPGQACCFGPACENRLPDECTDLGGVPRGEGTECDGDECTASCCFADGDCEDRGPTSCAADGGILGDPLTNCVDDPCPQPGACCAANGSCTEVAEDFCADDFQGEGTSCDPNPCPQPGACCAPEGTCTEVLETDCADDFQGEGTSCDPNPCPQPGACCAPDGTCTEVLETACADDFQGEGTSCDPNPCPQPGACCHADGSCTEVAEDFCTGTFQGEGTSCDPNPCPQPGACCAANGSCTEVAEDFCADDFQGEGTSCDPNPCPQPGACCAPEGTCTEVLETACTDDFLGEGTSCDPNPCPQPGACCAPEGTCTEVLEAACVDDFLGEGTSCDPNPCPQPGACCAPDGTCTEVPETACADDFLGEGTSCDPNPCPQP